jgi:predicted extracellular nuclease
MPFRVATFNVENLMNRFDFTGYRNELYQDRALALYQIRDELEYRQLEQARMIAHTDDARQLSALAIAATRADIVCLQEVDNLDALKAFEYGYLFKMIGSGYRHKFTTPGNDSRGIDVAVMMREETRAGEPIEFVRMTSHAHVTFGDLGPAITDPAALGEEPHERVFRRDCLELDLRIGGRPLTIYSLHLKSMTGARGGLDGRQASMPVRSAEAAAVRRIIEQRFGTDHAGRRNWLICGDLNDYRERVIVSGGEDRDYGFEPVAEAASALDVLLGDGFAVNLVERRPVLDRWTLYHTRGPSERHLCQLDYILCSPALAAANPQAVPDIVRAGQPWRTPFPPGQEVQRFPRTGWDRPKSSDHCPVAVTLRPT